MTEEKSTKHRIKIQLGKVLNRMIDSLITVKMIARQIIHMDRREEVETVESEEIQPLTLQLILLQMMLTWRDKEEEGSDSRGFKMIVTMIRQVKKKRKVMYLLLKNSILCPVLTIKNRMEETLTILLLLWTMARKKSDKIRVTSQICKTHQTYHLPHQSITMMMIRIRGATEREKNLNHLLQEELEMNKFVECFDEFT